MASAHVAKALFSYDKQVVFATHDTELITRAEYAIDRTLVVDDHQVVFDGGPHEAVAFYTDSSALNMRLPKPDHTHGLFPFPTCCGSFISVDDGTTTCFSRSLC